MSAELLIQNGNNTYIPVVVEGIEWSTERAGSPGKLTFKVIADDKLKITEGNAVRFKWDNKKIFFGFIFTRKTDKDGIVTITAYDQLRYLKNKATYVYENKKAGQVIKMIAKDFNLKTGSIADTKYKIKSKVEDAQTLFDIIQNALDDTLDNKKTLYVMYDDFGKIVLKSLKDMKVDDFTIDPKMAENYDYETSIDADVYNQIKLYYDNEDTGKRDVYVAKSSKNINKWGMLQYYESIEEGEDGKAKADALLELYNVKTRKLSFKNVIGDTRVRAGSLVSVMLKLDEVDICWNLLVESCKHVFNNGEHWMDITVKGGEFVA